MAAVQRAVSRGDVRAQDVTPELLAGHLYTQVSACLANGPGRRCGVGIVSIALQKFAIAPFACRAPTCGVMHLSFCR